MIKNAKKKNLKQQVMFNLEKKITVRNEESRY